MLNQHASTLTNPLPEETMSEIDSSRQDGANSSSDNYDAAYLDDDQADDDDDLAEMFAKVESIQESQGRRSTDSESLDRENGTRDGTDNYRSTIVDTPSLQQAAPTLALSSVTTEAPRGSGTPKLSSATLSTSRSARDGRSADGIKTISRHSGRDGPLPKDILLGPRKPKIFDEKILQAATSTDVLERLNQKTIAAPPVPLTPTLRFNVVCANDREKKRIETLSAPPKKDPGRRFATDDEERHCRFQTKKSLAQKAAEKDGYDADNQDSSNFIARMEVAERNRQKKLETTRGENEYNARLDKKFCPKCGVPQSYSEFHDKKKRCQTCGVEFRIQQAWGDIGQAFISRMSDAVRAQGEKQQQLRVRVVEEETQSIRVPKTARQRFYEKQMAQKNSQRTFLDRNYTPSSSSKMKQAEQEIQAHLAAKRATA